jgi:excisionase family DNA binding protein
MSTFEEVPRMLVQLLKEVEELKQLLSKPETPVIQMDRYMTTTEAASYLRLSRQTVYGLVCNSRLNKTPHKIPYIKRGNQLRFVERDLAEWLRAK